MKLNLTQFAYKVLTFLFPMNNRTPSERMGTVLTRVRVVVLCVLNFSIIKYLYKFNQNISHLNEVGLKGNIRKKERRKRKREREKERKNM